MTRKPVFWILLVVFSAAGIALSVRYFSEAFPIVTLDLRIDRAGVLSKARELAERVLSDPAEYNHAASFSGDREVQVFVELEGGGTQAFQEMMKSGFYMPYTWKVRHYRPGETKEAGFVFTPDGRPYGFSVKLPEKEPGAAFPADTALRIATTSASTEWGIDLSAYVLVEQSQEVRPSGRIDHTFVYERPNIMIGEGRYRLRLVVGGDRLTELTHFVKVPEAFKRRYQEMRSANEAIGVASSLGMAILYIVIGCGVGLFYLLRQRYILWRQPLLWAGVIAALQFFVGVNQLPLVWMDYDTAVSVENFLLQQLGINLLNALALGILFAVSFMAAESLSRKAFPHHLQQWRLWSPAVASSKAVLGRTLAGYLLVGIFFAYEVGVYFVGTRWLGWWTPSDILFHPDVLATYLPWLTSIGVSAQAGFWEESLFRAVPLAGAALLGDRFGGRKWWIAAAMIVQALVFGGGHAGYANQPAYARVVELIIPSLMFGGIFLRFGLLPAVVLHFAFDVVWFSLPLFLSSAPGVWVNQLLVILFTLVPLFVVLVARVRMKRWNEIPADAYNSAWTPPPAEEKAERASPESTTAQPIVAAVRYLPVVGLTALVVWGSLVKFSADAPALNVSRTDAITISRNALRDRGIELGEPWKPLTTIAGNPGEDDRFIWQTMGKEMYAELLGDYLPPPHWKVRFVRFEGNVAERAEEYGVFINGNGEVFRIQHRLPEDREGAAITEQDARILVHLTLNGLWSLDASKLKEVSAVPSKLKNRTDWTFTFADTARHRLKEGGEARIAVYIAGDTVADAYKFIHIPEEWSRRERDARAIPGIIQTASMVVNVLIVLAAMVIAIVRWSRKSFSVRLFLVLFVVLLVAGAVNVVNGFPGLESVFQTAQPYSTQLFIIIGASVVGLFIMSVALGLVGGMVSVWKEQRQLFPTKDSWLCGASLAAIFVAITAVTTLADGARSPLWGSYDPLNTYIPLADVLADAMVQVLTRSLILLFVFIGIDRLSDGWQRRTSLAAALLVVYGFILAGGRQPESVLTWAVTGAAVGFLVLAAFIYYVRFDARVIPVAVATVTVLGLLRQYMLNAYPEVTVASIVGGILALMTAWAMHRGLVKVSGG